MGDARDWEPNFQYPIPGAAVLLPNHVAIVVGIIGDSIVIAESNQSLDDRIDIGRTLKIGDPRINGYYVPNLTLALTIHTPAP